MWQRLRTAIARKHLVDKGVRLTGVALATSGFAHFVAPSPFVAISRPVFPERTARWVKINGGSEAAIGLALIDSRTRVFGVIGLLVYGAHLTERAGMAVVRRYRAGNAVSEPTFAE